MHGKLFAAVLGADAVEHERESLDGGDDDLLAVAEELVKWEVLEVN